MESASSPRSIYAKVQVLLERWPHAGGVERKALLSIMREIEELNLEEKDILSMADLAVAIVALLPELHPEAASNMLCLLKPIEEEPLPSKRTADWRIWEIFAAAGVQWQQIQVLACYGRLFTGKSSCTYGLANSPLAMSTEKKLADLMAAFKDVQSQLEGRISSDLHSKMREFTKNLESHSTNVRCHTLQAGHQLTLEASEIARELRSLPNLPGASPESSEESGSWSLVEETVTAAEVAADAAADVGSVASCGSVDTQMSYLAGGFMKTVLPVLFISLLLVGMVDPKGLYDE